MYKVDFVPPKEKSIHVFPTAELALDLQADWRREALCRELIAEQEYLANAWVDERDTNAAYAKKACGECPVRDECFASALQDPKAYGLRDGYFFNNGALVPRDVANVMKKRGVIVRTRQKVRVYSSNEEDPES